MNCKDINSKLIFYIEGDLAPDLENKIKNHLQSCDSCMHLYENMKLTLGVIDKEKNEIKL